MLNIILESVKKYSNFIQKCPYNIGILSAVDFPVDTIDFPPFVPAADYRIDIRVFNDKNVTILGYNVFLTIEAKGIHQLLVG